MPVRLHLQCPGTPEQHTVFVLHSLTVLPSLCISYYVYLLSSFLLQIGRKRRGWVGVGWGTFSPVYRLKVIRNRKVAYLYS